MSYSPHQALAQALSPNPINAGVEEPLPLGLLGQEIPTAPQGHPSFLSFGLVGAGQGEKSCLLSISITSAENHDKRILLF